MRPLFTTCLVISLLSGMAAAAQAVVLASKTEDGLVIEIIADAAEMGFADTLPVSITVTAPENLAVSLPRGDDAWGPFSILSTDLAGAQKTGDGLQVWRSTYELSAKETGPLALPAQDISVHHVPDGPDTACVYFDNCDERPTHRATSTASGRYRTPEATLTVTTVLPPEADMTRPMPIVPPRPIAAATPLWPWALALAGSLIVAVGLWLHGRRRPGADPPAAIPAEGTALAALAALRAEWSRGTLSPGSFYQRLATILRRYLDHRYHYPALARTRPEIAGAAPRLGIVEAARAGLDRLLAFADRVRFADRRPDPTPETDLDRATDFVKATGRPE